MRDRRILIGDFTRREFREMLQAGTLKAAIVPTGPRSSTSSTWRCVTTAPASRCD